MVCEEGGTCEGLYVLHQGFAKETVKSAAGAAEATVNLLKPGQVHGLIALIDGGPCASTLVTMQPSEFLVIPRENFVQELKKHPDVYWAALNNLCGEVRQARQWVRTLV